LESSATDRYPATPAPNLHFYNNLFLAESYNAPVVNIGGIVPNDIFPIRFPGKPNSSLDFQGNDYYAGPQGLQVVVNGTSTHGLAAFENMARSSPSEMSLDPMIMIPLPGYSITSIGTMAMQLKQAKDFILLDNAPARIRSGGVSLIKEISGDVSTGDWWAPDLYWQSYNLPSPQDFFGVPLATAGSAAFSIGASQFSP